MALGRGPDIFKDGGFEQAAVLEHKGDLIHEHMGIDLPHIHAAHLHRAGGGVPEAGDQAGGGGLAAAGGPHQGHGLPRLRCEGDMGEGGCLRAVVSKAHILKFHTAASGFLRMVRLFQFRAPMTWSMRPSAVLASIMPDAANMIWQAPWR